MRKQRGFTLIEVMIVTLVIAIIAGIAVPSYQNSVRKANRAEALETLIDVAFDQETLYAQTNAYSTNAQPFAPVAATLTTPNGLYLVSVANGACGSTACFIATATPQGAQVSDTQCATISIDNLGNKTSTPAGGNCWR